MVCRVPENLVSDGMGDGPEDGWMLLRQAGDAKLLGFLFFHSRQCSVSLSEIQTPKHWRMQRRAWHQSS